MPGKSNFRVGINFSEPLLTINIDDLSSDEHAFLEANNKERNVRDVKTVSSYNWMDHPVPTIALINLATLIQASSNCKSVDECWKGQICLRNRCVATNTKPPSSLNDGERNSVLSAGLTLYPGAKMVSSNGLYRAEMQFDGNFVVYDSSNFPVFSADTHRREPVIHRLVMQYDNNVVIYNASEQPVWDSKTHGQGVSPGRLELSNAGHLRIFDAGYRLIKQLN